MALPGKIEVEVGLPGQDSSLVTLEIVRTHVRMQVTPVAVDDGRVVAVVGTTIVGAIVAMTNGTNV